MGEGALGIKGNKDDKESRDGSLTSVESLRLPSHQQPIMPWGYAANSGGGDGGVEGMGVGNLPHC